MNKQVLLIEDDVDQILLYKTELLAAHIDTIAANGGQIGVTMAKEKHPGVIVLDLVMEGMNGEEVLRHLKTDPQTRDIPVIVFTNLDKPPVRDKMLSLGAKEFWGKTELTPSELAVKVKAYLTP